jgi:hypothetical protein
LFRKVYIEQVFDNQIYLCVDFGANSWRERMPISAPSAEAVRKMSDDIGLSVTAGEAAEYAALIAGVLPAYDAVTAFMASDAKPQTTRVDCPAAGR